MSNYHLEVKYISRGKGHSLTRQANYISGRTLHDAYLGKTYYATRQDVLYVNIFLPQEAPTAFQDLNSLCHAMDGAERRWDARTARSLTGSLPNELDLPEWTQIVETFIDRNFINHNLCAIAAIHHGRNLENSKKDNPHVHILVSTRTAGPDGFSSKKARALETKDTLLHWREEWAWVQNQAYQRCGLDTRVNHKSLREQNIYDREPTAHLRYMDWQKAQRNRQEDAETEKQINRQRSRRAPVPERKYGPEPSR